MLRRREGGGPERPAIAPLPVIKHALRRFIMVSQQGQLPRKERALIMNLLVPRELRVLPMITYSLSPILPWS
jgi:hypothetical protein